MPDDAMEEALLRAMLATYEGQPRAVVERCRRELGEELRGGDARETGYANDSESTPSVGGPRPVASQSAGRGSRELGSEERRRGADKRGQRPQPSRGTRSANHCIKAEAGNQSGRLRSSKPELHTGERMPKGREVCSVEKTGSEEAGVGGSHLEGAPRPLFTEGE